VYACSVDNVARQGLAFLTRYRELRGEDATEEVEYNFARAFHQLGMLPPRLATPKFGSFFTPFLFLAFAGLLSLAVKHYERVLAHVEQRVAANPDVSALSLLLLIIHSPYLADATVEADIGVASETAYNLSIIYVTTGAAPLAQQLYRRWLSI
jgi:general transcription factor 3C polypeptide 3 (transcription factor C subunit 4)